MDVESLFLKYSVDKLTQLSERIEVCLAALNEDQIWARGGENENSVGNLVLHLTGNVRQWIVNSLGNNPSSRDRDSEFNTLRGPNGPELSLTLRDTVEQAAQVISWLDTGRLTRTYDIQNYVVSGVEAVYHVVEHFGQHTGQIIFVTKMMTGRDLEFYAHLRSPGRAEQAP